MWKPFLRKLFKIEVEGRDGSIIKVNEVKKVLNSRMMEVFQGSNLGKIFEEM